MKRKLAAFLVSIIAAVGLLAMPASASQGGFYWQQTRNLTNGCHVTWSMGHQTQNAGYNTAWMTYSPNQAACWYQMNVSYWTWDGVWHVWSSAWIGNPPGIVDFQFGPSPGLWYVDFNTNNGGTITGWRQYGLGCNSSGC